MKFWFSRASSHSEIYCEVARFDSAEQAEKAANALRAFVREVDQNYKDYDWSEDDANCRVAGDRLCFSVYTAGYGLDEVDSIIEKEGGKVVAEGNELHSVSFTVTKQSWNEVNATVMVVNLLHDRVLDPESYLDAWVNKSKKEGGKCVWTLEAITDSYDDDSGEVNGVSFEELRQLGIIVSADCL